MELGKHPGAHPGALILDTVKLDKYLLYFRTLYFGTAFDRKKEMTNKIKRIRTGGQTGVDRAALDTAI